LNWKLQRVPYIVLNCHIRRSTHGLKYDRSFYAPSQILQSASLPGLYPEVSKRNSTKLLQRVRDKSREQTTVKLGVILFPRGKIRANRRFPMTSQLKCNFDDDECFRISANGKSIELCQTVGGKSRTKCSKHFGVLPPEKSSPKAALCFFEDFET